MRFVLKDGTDYFGGYHQNEYYLTRQTRAPDLESAVIFTMTLLKGKPVVSPDLPDEGDWVPVAVTATLKEQ